MRTLADWKRSEFIPIVLSYVRPGRGSSTGTSSHLGDQVYYYTIKASEPYTGTSAITVTNLYQNHYTIKAVAYAITMW